MNSIEVIQKVASEELRKLRTVELGIVTSVFPHADGSDRDNYACNVMLKTTELELRNVPVATQIVGLACAPKAGDLVLLAFVNGSIHAPIVIGRLYNSEDRPPVNNTGEIVFEQPGDGDSSLRRLYLKFPGGTEVTIKDDQVDVSLGSSKLTIEKDGDVVVEAGGDVKIKSGGSTTIEAGGDLNLKGSGTVNIKGSMVNIN